MMALRLCLEEKRLLLRFLVASHQVLGQNQSHSRYAFDVRIRGNVWVGVLLCRTVIRHPCARVRPPVCPMCVSRLSLTPPGVFGDGKKTPLWPCGSEPGHTQADPRGSTCVNAALVLV